ncbi:hypothetical protein WBP06_03000 [Novosphingobium sp. BL-8H]|uniref:hypothetical protein n=1 Tax=Novosphingobium sp. BL-8H TaxID=3127640 RepID=UPI003757E559
MAVFTRRVLESVALIGATLAPGSVHAQQTQPAPTSPIVVQGDKPAAAPQPAASPSAIDQADPVVCEKIQEIGSRLKVKKVCLTKSQWDAQRREDRMNIERSQITRGVGPN